MRGFLGNEIEALVFAVLFSLLLAAAIALIILRRRGLYFSLLTLAFSQIAFEIAFKWTDLTGGENGLQGVPRPWLAGDWSFHVFTVVTVTARHVAAVAHRACAVRPRRCRRCATTNSACTASATTRSA